MRGKAFFRECQATCALLDGEEVGDGIKERAWTRAEASRQRGEDGKERGWKGGR